MKKALSIGILGLAVGVTLVSCKKDENSPYVEYMPDMYRSAAIEPYVDYGILAGEDHPELRMRQSAMAPVYGTVPWHGTGSDVEIFLPYNRLAPQGSGPLYNVWYTPEDSGAYNAAAADMEIPLEATPDVLAEGKRLYGLFCTHCHGEAGDGQGKVVQRGFVSGVPNYQTLEISPGQMFYSITYGKGKMGAHNMLLDKKERWMIVHHILELQGKSAGSDEEGTSSADSTAAAMPAAEADSLSQPTE